MPALSFSPQTRTAVVALALLVAVRALEPLVTLLRLEAQSRDRTRLEAADADRLVSLLAIAVAAFLDTAQREVDLGDQLALAIAGTQLERAIGLERGAIGEVGLVQALGLH